MPSIPFLLTSHVIGARVGLSQFGLEKGYAQELINFWVGSPLLGALQAILLLIVWIHGCLGLHFWLRLKPSYPRVREPLLAAAVLLPALALLGDDQGGQRTLAAVVARTLSPEHVGDPTQNTVLLNERIRAALTVLRSRRDGEPFTPWAARSRLARASAAS
jgi:adenylate cyclase